MIENDAYLMFDQFQNNGLFILVGTKMRYHLFWWLFS